MVNFKSAAYLWGIRLLTMVTILGSGVNYTSQRSFAQDDQPPPKFFCGTYQGSPATMVTTPRGDVAIIVWLLDDLGYTPLERCEEVSKRFQRAYDQGILKYIITGTVNRYLVICATDAPGGGCRQVLFTLPPGTNASTIVRQLFLARRGEGKPAEVYPDSEPVVCLSRNKDGLCSGWLFSIVHLPL